MVYFQQMDVQLIYPGELTPGVAAEEYAGRRRKLMAGLPPNSLVVLPSASTTYMSGVVPYLYRQDADFFYLTGIQQHGVLALSTRDGKCVHHMQSSRQPVHTSRCSRVIIKLVPEGPYAAAPRHVSEALQMAKMPA